MKQTKFKTRLILIRVINYRIDFEFFHWCKKNSFWWNYTNLGSSMHSLGSFFIQSWIFISNSQNFTCVLCFSNYQKLMKMPSFKLTRLWTSKFSEFSNKLFLNSKSKTFERRLHFNDWWNFHRENDGPIHQYFFSFMKFNHTKNNILRFRIFFAVIFFFLYKWL